MVVLAALVAPAAPPALADTVLAVERGTRLDVENWRGRVVVQVWDRDAVRVRASGEGSQRPDIVRAGAILRVRTESSPDRPAETDFTITVPRWLDVRIQGQNVDAAVRGTGGEVSVETVGGTVLIEDGTRVRVRAINGAVTVRNTRGRVEVWNVNQSVRVEGVAGEVSVESTNGAITMTGIHSEAVRGSTVNGSISYDGSIMDSGRYAFSTHNGRIDVVVPETTNATVSAATYHGAFRAEFPVSLTGMSRDRHYDFTLGSGLGRLELESFNGDITLRRPR